MEKMNIPKRLVYPLERFGDSFKSRAATGFEVIQQSKVAFVGLARNCAVRLAENLGRLESLAATAREWCLHIESNDCEDATLDVLHDFTKQHKQATFHYQVLGRRQYGAEFAGPRTIALAEYRDACQRWVKACAADADYVVVIDWDQWGGWSHAGFMNGLGWLVELQGAYGMASVSLAEYPMLSMGEDRKPKVAPNWVQYDAWALRMNSTWDDYTAGQGGWKHQWLPPVGSDPVRVCSAFGGLAIYRRDAYLKGTYDGTTDCEHVPFHDSIARATGQHLYLCPSMRCLMSWLPEDAPDARQHGDD